MRKSKNKTFDFSYTDGGHSVQENVFYAPWRPDWFSVGANIQNLLEMSIRMENESRKSEEQSRKLIQFKNQWFVSTESESDLDDSVMIRIRIVL